MTPQLPAAAKPVKLYRNPKSGHCHSVELMMALLQGPYETIDLDMAHGALTDSRISLSENPPKCFA